MSWISGNYHSTIRGRWTWSQFDAYRFIFLRFVGRLVDYQCDGQLGISWPSWCSSRYGAKPRCTWRKNASSLPTTLGAVIFVRSVPTSASSRGPVDDWQFKGLFKKLLFAWDRRPRRKWLLRPADVIGYCILPPIHGHSTKTMQRRPVKSISVIRS